MEDVQHAIGDRYELLSAVGAGGMGFVYSARHVTLGHVVAVKVLPPEVAASEMRLRRFQQEAALAASLAHPHIVPVYDFGVRAGITFLIMPFVRGRTLEGMLARERPSLDAALRVAREIGAALDHAHERGVVHRDVKPSNILIDGDTGRALLTDFGVAHVVRVATSPLTAPGVPIGTPDYMAPEQAAGEERLDGRADLYSLAVVTFETLTGTRPAEGSDRATLARALRGARPELAPPSPPRWSLRLLRGPTSGLGRWRRGSPRWTGHGPARGAAGPQRASRRSPCSPAAAGPCAVPTSWESAGPPR